MASRSSSRHSRSFGSSSCVPSTRTAARHSRRSSSAARIPVGDLVVTYALVVAVQRRRDRGDGAVLGTLLGGMLLLIAADVYFAYLEVNGSYSGSSIVNVGWPFGFLLIAYAAALATSSPLSSDPVEENEVRPVEWLLPGGLFALLISLAVAAARADSVALGAPMFAVVLVAALALVARLAINFGLAREIEGRRERLVAWMLERTRAA